MKQKDLENVPLFCAAGMWLSAVSAAAAAGVGAAALPYVPKFKFGTGAGAAAYYRKTTRSTQAAGNGHRLHKRTAMFASEITLSCSRQQRLLVSYL